LQEKVAETVILESGHLTGAGRQHERPAATVSRQLIDCT
jgi:hypothetical protein